MGMIKATTNGRSVSIWTNSHHLCRLLLAELLNDNMHREENLERITSDAEDRQKIRITLRKCIHPLQADSHASYLLVNIYTGEESISLLM